jgi:hypothetical protein
MMNTRQHRTLHLVDVENLVGSGRPTARDLEAVHRLYRELQLVGGQDHIVVACNPYVAVEVADAWAPARLRVGHGPSGADLQLLDVALHERITSRFDHVVIGSGDGVFTEVTVGLQAAGLPVTVVSRRGHLALRLRMAASQVLYLDEPLASPAVAVRKVA